ncbi:MAG TPA: phosphate signaling complex protein PhoU [Anaerolineales bacterium]|nr:phosphate signaling complex protein PhoU [Anaerolineales bacterium]
MPRKTFGQEMHELKDEVLLLSSMVEQAVLNSVEALKNNDLEQSRQTHANDLVINRKRFEIEFSIMVLIATQQPIAHDLRLLTASLHICTELERIGDYAKGIANINIRSQGLSLPDMLRDIDDMAEKAVDMLHRAMTTLAEEDARTAKSIVREDSTIDECYTRLYYKAVNNVLGDPRNVERANFVIWAAHNLERLGGRVSNICEQVIYIVTGEHPDLESVSQKPRLPQPEL